MAVTIPAMTIIANQAGPNLAASILDTNWSNIRDAITGLVPLVSELAGARDYTGTQGWGKGADIADAAAVSLGSDGNYFVVLGATTVTSISTKTAGTIIALRWNSARTITHNATTLILAYGINYAAISGDVMLFVSEGGGNWREIARSRQVIAKNVVRKTDDFTTTSATYVDVTGCSITLTTGARRVLLIATMRCGLSATGTEGRLAFDIGGTDTADLGSFRCQTSTSERGTVTIQYLTDALTAGSNVFKLQARSPDGATTLTLQGATDSIIFTAVEIDSP